MIWWLLGYENDEEVVADDRQKHLKYLVCEQIKKSNLRLKPIKKRKKKRR